MPLVEVIRGEKTDDKTLDLGVALAKRLGKEVVICRKDVPGFIVNRILGPLLNEAAWTVGRGEATVEQVDSAAVYKVGLPMGLFELADYTGIDVIYKAAEAVKSREPSAILGAPLFRGEVRTGKAREKDRARGSTPTSDKQSRPAISKETGRRSRPAALLLGSRELGSLADQKRGLHQGGPRPAVRLGLGFPDGILQSGRQVGHRPSRLSAEGEAERPTGGLRPGPAPRGDGEKGELGSSGKGFYDYSTT